MLREEKFLYDAFRTPVECIIISSKMGNIVEYPIIPLEDGTTILDTWVIHNTRVTLDIICPIPSYSKLKNLRDKGKPFSLDMDSGQVQNLYISEMNEVNDASIVGELRLIIELIQYFRAIGKATPVIIAPQASEGGSKEAPVDNGGSSSTVNTSPTIKVQASATGEQCQGLRGSALFTCLSASFI